ncbi:HlyD family efflux transporter periplasmic adaptor subunit [Methylomonas montana]|uniref:HlyD family efflux transporter periplasmic adaptor subunit n=1 Tax=Methylomonas montana TaxID=3058963 RepID=UPI0026586EB8|nr:HlyD family efflux transporter periplasmic adaptor subunit [Methylomonas montana]WKJ91626.1 HlyD family efflux transporter periplasmic adaptor subunit [Methylomonas montana]
MNAGKPTEYALLRSLGDPQLAMEHPVAKPLLWTSLLSIACFVGWANWAELDEVTRGDGRVVPFSRIQKIQSLEGGILEQLMVKEGDLVETGQLLVKLDNTRFNSAFLESKSHAEALTAAIARLEAETLNKDKITFPDSVPAKSHFAATETALFKARRAKHHEAVHSLNSELDLVRKQLQVIEPLVASRAASEMEALRLRKEIASLSGKLSEVNNAYFQETYTELASKRAEFSELEQNLLQRKDQLSRTQVLSPVKGRVNDILITTRGGVIQPGEPIMEVTPIDEQLLVEAKVKPRDVAFLVPGMPAQVKITAYDYTVYGDLSGTLEQISPDTIEEESIRGKESFYKILIRTSTSYLKKGDEILPIKPGMIAEVDIQSGKRTVLNYLLRPLLKARLY